MRPPSFVTRRRLVASAALLAALALAFAAVLWLTWPESLESRVKRIRPGMTRAEVQDVVGVTPGNYCRRVMWQTKFWTDLPSDPPAMAWEWDEGLLVVWFSAEGRATRTSFTLNPDPPPPPPLWDRIRDRLPW